MIWIVQYCLIKLGKISVKGGRVAYIIVSGASLGLVLEKTTCEKQREAQDKRVASNSFSFIL